MIAWSVPGAASGWLALAYLACFRWERHVGHWPTAGDSTGWFRDTVHFDALEVSFFLGIWTVMLWTAAMFVVIAIDFPRTRHFVPFLVFWAVPAWLTWIDGGRILNWLGFL